MTGGAGFVGSHLADILSESGYKVRIFDVRESQHLRPDQEMIVGDLRDISAVEDAAAGCEAVYHFGGIADIREANLDPVLVTEVNIGGTTNLLSACYKHSVKRFILASTVYVYSNEGGFYRASKRACETLVETYQEELGLPFTILRFGTLYGRRAGRGNRIHDMIRQALDSSRIEYPGNANAMREFIHVRDAGRLACRVLEDQFANKHYVLTGQERYKISEAARMIGEILPGSIDVSFNDMEPEGHYELTPYAYSPKIGHKLVPSDYVDFGQGLLDCIREQHDESAKSVVL